MFLPAANRFVYRAMQPCGRHYPPEKMPDKFYFLAVAQIGMWGITSIVLGGTAALYASS
jgi:hypothetical protein